MRSAAAVRPSAVWAAQQRGHGLAEAVAVLQLAEPLAGQLGQRRGVLEVPLPQPQVGLQGLHHRRRPGVAALLGLDGHLGGQLLGRVEVAEEELDVGQQAEHPADTVAIAELLERGRRVLQLLVGRLEVAGQEPDPGAVLLHPGHAAPVAELAEQRIGLAEEPLGIDQRPAEQLDEAA